MSMAFVHVADTIGVQRLAVLATKGLHMAVQKEDSLTGSLPLGGSDKAWVQTALAQLATSMERARAKYPADSSMYKAVTADLAQVNALKEKFS